MKRCQYFVFMILLCMLLFTGCKEEKISDNSGSVSDVSSDLSDMSAPQERNWGCRKRWIMAARPLIFCLPAV